MAEHLAGIVEAGTTSPVGEPTVTSIRCTRRPGRRPCAGLIEVVRLEVPASIEWWCPICGDEGVVSGWEGSPFDLRWSTSHVDVPADPPPERLGAQRGRGLARISGRWRIIEMELWDQDAIDLLGPAFIEFGPDNTGSFRFIAVEGWMDVRPSPRDGLPGVDFTWDGYDEGDRTTGRGWATLGSDGALTGRIFIHLGDDSSFAAVPEQDSRTPSSRPPRRRR